MKLVIVESPAKCTTIQKYLGNDYVVKASLGHIRDLSTSGKGGLGVDVENGFTPTYTINKDKYQVVKSLEQLAKNSDEVILATDPDREGEAIAWHLAKVLNLDIDTNKRWEFHEITRDSISNASKNPRTIDLNIVSSQETRRILDRIIGFKLSSLLYKKIHSRSAGRVQSATLKLIYDHELEIDKFVPEEYYDINVKTLLNNKEIDLKYLDYLGKNKEVKDAKTAEAIINALPEKAKVVSVKKSIRTVESKEPFTTSTMQQEAFAKLKFKTKKTQYVAQTLYEGITVNDEHVGLITYMRTDSTRLSPSFIQRATAYILETFGPDYLGQPKRIKEIGNVQDAHEAIRPTSNHRTPESVRKFLSPDQYNLYKLIYDRAVASLMKAKKEEVLEIILDGNGVRFKIEMVRTIFKGYTVLYKDDTNKNHDDLPAINEGDEFVITSKSSEQKFTQAPAHYSEAKVVKLMEEVGIGRPSTYSSTIETLKKRKYVEDDKGLLVMTEQGRKTAHVLNKYFPDIVNTKYTADMENKLDSVQEGSKSRLDMLTNFYLPFIQNLADASEKMYEDEMIPTGEMCPKCGAPLIYKEGKNGQFIGCSAFPKCDYVKKEEKEAPIFVGRNCPNCGKPLVERKDNKGNVFVACSGYPSCKYIETNDKKPVPEKYVKKCPDCDDGYLVKKKGKFGYFLGCSNYPKCKHMEPLKKVKSK